MEIKHTSAGIVHNTSNRKSLKIQKKRSFCIPVSLKKIIIFLLGIGYSVFLGFLYFSIPDRKLPNHLTVSAPELSDQQLNVRLPSKSDRACRVIIENIDDFHYEIIESVVQYYPLPWDTFNCTIAKPIIFDFSLHDNYFYKASFYIGGKKPKNLRHTEFWGWKTYFEASLKGKVIQRYEQRFESSAEMLFSKKTQAYFNSLISKRQYDESPNGPADAIINISCKTDKKNEQIIKKDKRRYCVLHRYVPEFNGNEYLRSKTCWLSPMFPTDHCFFLPLALPQTQKQFQNTKELQVCAPGGGGRNQRKLIRMFLEIPYTKYNVTLKILTRVIQKPAVMLTKIKRLQDQIKFISEKDFAKYYETVSNCNIYLPLTDPKERPSFFQTYVLEGKSLSGSIPPIIKYKIPSVMHTELEAIYHKYWTAPVEVYEVFNLEEVTSQAAALSRMIEKLQKT